MSLSLAQAQQQVSGGSPAYGSNVTSGNLLVLVGISAATVTGITSTQGGTWSPVSGAQSGHGFVLQVWWTVATSSGAETLSVTGSTYSEAYIYEVTGFVGTPSLDQATGANGNSGDPTAGPVTTLNAPEFGVGYCFYSGSGSAGGAGWTDTVTGFGNVVEYIFQPTNTALTATSTPSDTGWLAVIATFGAVNTTLVGESDVVFATSGSMAGAGALAGSSSVGFNASLYIPQFAKLGDWDPTAYAITWFDGTEDSGGWWDRVDIPNAAPGAISAAATVVFTASATLALFGESDVVFASTSTPTITGSSSVIFAASGTLSGTGVLIGASGVVFATAATLTATGALVGSSAAVFAASTTPTIQGASAVVFAASATPAVQASTSVVFTAAGTLVATGALVGESDAVFTAAGALASPALMGASNVVFSAWATATQPISQTLGGWYSYGGSQPVPALPKRKRRRFRTAAEILLEKEEAQRQRKAAAAASAAARQAAVRADLLPAPARPVIVERAAPIVGTAVSTVAASVGQHAQGTSRHVGKVAQLVRNADTARAESAELENARLRRAMAKIHVDQIHAEATRARADTLASLLPDVDPAVIKAMASPPIVRKLRRAS